METTIARRCAAEALGTFWLVFGGTGTAVFAIITRGTDQATVGLVGVALAFGLTVVTGAYALGHISGGHFNPAVTVGLAVGKRFPWSDVVAYVVAQVLGGIAASGLVWAIAAGVPGGFHRKVGELASNGFGHNRGFYSLGSVLVAEAVLTMVFVIVIMGVTHQKAPVGFAPLAIGLTLVLIHLISIPISNTSVNPARSTGPAVFEAGHALSQLWVFWLAPLVGGAAGGALFAFLRPADA